jgi:hypothetical protein
VISKFVRLLWLAVLLGPASCLDESGPPTFTTEGTCYPGDTLFCEGCPDDALGLRTCTSRGRFGPCKCPGCTSYPDCEQCGSRCFDSCMCQTAHRSEAACRHTCGSLEADGAAP